MFIIMCIAAAFTVGVVAGSWFRHHMLCGPTCTPDEFNRTVAEVEDEAWARGFRNGEARGKGEHTPREVAYLDSRSAAR